MTDRLDTLIYWLFLAALTVALLSIAVWCLRAVLGGYTLTLRPNTCVQALHVPPGTFSVNPFTAVPR